ncbi:hypothetical protein ZIOFF_013935 [Zingiber officinale]|uniref:ABC transporter C family member 3 n=1 Tax=Zingiber officinale TaxID=94328 RepID=A0A8J5HD38_ZINOF|nr:hypothetical protein ZIOFF_013935 [Zingiber officinale]
MKINTRLPCEVCGKRPHPYPLSPSLLLSLPSLPSRGLLHLLGFLLLMLFGFWFLRLFCGSDHFWILLALGIPLSSGKVLSALATFRVLQEPIYNLPDTISMIIQTKVSLDRIASFLRLEELHSDISERLPSGTSEIAVEVVNGTFSWNHSSDSPTLNDLNFKVLRGMKVAVCGTVGSGKSSLLSSLLGEVPKISGSVRLCGTTAYVPQSPWIQSGKIQDNILFGREMDHEKYDKVLEACSLKKDLEILALGDQTVIGERGINLSGGQKQRIQIARALYHDADIFLFDDPFSAVDAHTGTHLFKCMKDGRVVQAGKYYDMLMLGTEFRELVTAHKEALAALDSIELGSVAPDNNAQVGNSDTKIGLGSPSHGVNNDTQNCLADETYSQKGQLFQEEEREKGRVGFWVYWKYVTMAYGGAHLILLAQVLLQVFQIGSNYWMAWAAPVSEDEQPPVTGSMLIYVYVALAVGSSFCILMRAMLLVTAGYKTATLLFNKLHNCIFRAPMSFFDSTPSGRILNRASTDQNAVDTDIPTRIGAVAFNFIQLVGIVAVMSQVLVSPIKVLLHDEYVWDASTGQKHFSSGCSLLALGSNAVHKLWQWPCDERNPSGKSTASVAPQLCQPPNGILMTNERSDNNPEEATACIVLSKNDSYTTSASGGKVSLLNMRTFKVITTFMPTPPAATSLAFHPADNNMIAAGMEDSSILIYNIRIDEVNGCIQELQLNSSGIGDEGARVIADMLKENQTLRVLELNNNMIEYSGFARKITLLDIGNNEIGPKGAFSIAEFVKKTKSLLRLNLYMNDIGDAFTNLKYSRVEIDEVRELGVKRIAVVRRFKELEVCRNAGNFRELSLRKCSSRKRLKMNSENRISASLFLVLIFVLLETIVFLVVNFEVEFQTYATKEKSSLNGCNCHEITSNCIIGENVEFCSAYFQNQCEAIPINLINNSEIQGHLSLVTRKLSVVIRIIAVADPPLIG